MPPSTEMICPVIKDSGACLREEGDRGLADPRVRGQAGLTRWTTIQLT